MARKVLGPGERRRTMAVFEALFPSGHGLPGARETDLVGFWEEYLAAVPRHVAFGVRLVVFLVAWTPLLFIGRPRSLHALGPEDRQRHLDAWAHSRVYWVRECVVLLKAVLLLGWGRHASVRAAMGMEAPR